MMRPMMPITVLTVSRIPSGVPSNERTRQQCPAFDRQANDYQFDEPRKRKPLFVRAGELKCTTPQWLIKKFLPAKALALMPAHQLAVSRSWRSTWLSASPVVLTGMATR